VIKVNLLESVTDRTTGVAFVADKVSSTRTQTFLLVLTVVALLVLGIGYAYVSFGGLPWIQAIFYGVGAAVIGIVAIGSYKLTTKNLNKDKLLWAIYLVTAGVTVWTQSESVWLFLGAGVLVWLVRAPPKRWFGKSAAPALIALSPHGPSACAVATGVDWTLLAQLGAFFAKAGAFVFGSGLAIVPFLYGGVVHDHQWLNEFPPFNVLNPSAENIARYIYEEVSKGLGQKDATRLAFVKLWETDTASAIYRP